MIFISHPLLDSPPDDLRYAKGPQDLVFVLYHIIVFSFVRQFTLFNIIHPFALRLGIKRGTKLERFGEQVYALLYYGAMGVWGMVGPLKLTISHLIANAHRPSFLAYYDRASYVVVSDTILLDWFCHKHSSFAIDF